LHLSQLLLKNNYDVVAIGREVDKLDDLRLKYNSSQFQVLQHDLSDLTSYETIFEKSFQNKKFDGIVNCAGFEETLPISLYTPEKIHSIFTLNVFAGIELLRFFSKKKYSNDEASVVFISSVMAEL
jgi:short-subunit dehydrogenase